MSDRVVGPEKDKACIASMQLKLNFAATRKLSGAPVQILYDLCTTPKESLSIRMSSSP